MELGLTQPDKSDIAALYVQAGGAYYGLPGVDPWDKERDARRYPGSLRVVAHPPCARWSIMGTCRGYRDGKDEGCFAAALEAVRRFGGVLEHPRYTLAWETFALPRPAAAGWTRSLMDDGWTCEVDQRHYGHEARKPTWLYYVGPPPPLLIWGPGSRGHLTTHTMHSKRDKTPPAFRDVLLSLARAG